MLAVKPAIETDSVALKAVFTAVFEKEELVDAYNTVTFTLSFSPVTVTVAVVDDPTLELIEAPNGTVVSDMLNRQMYWVIFP